MSENFQPDDENSSHIWSNPIVWTMKGVSGLRAVSRELIKDCWATEPDDRPSFQEIVDRLIEMKLKVMWNVNSSKLLMFLKEIEKWEKCNEAAPILHLDKASN
jgi:hypothetical protein